MEDACAEVDGLVDNTIHLLTVEELKGATCNYNILQGYNTMIDDK